MRRARDARGGRRSRLLRRTGRRGLLGQLRRLRHRAYQQEFIGETRKADRHSPVRSRPTAAANTAAGGRGDDRTQPAQNENRLAKPPISSSTNRPPRRPAPEARKKAVPEKSGSGNDRNPTIRSISTGRRTRGCAGPPRCTAAPHPRAANGSSRRPPRE